MIFFIATVGLSEQSTAERGGKFKPSDLKNGKLKCDGGVENEAGEKVDNERVGKTKTKETFLKKCLRKGE